MRPRPLGVARSCSQSGNVAVLARGKLHFTCNLELVDSRPSQRILELAGNPSQLNLAGNKTTRGEGSSNFGWFCGKEQEVNPSKPCHLRVGPEAPGSGKRARHVPPRCSAEISVVDRSSVRKCAGSVLGKRFGLCTHSGDDAFLRRHVRGHRHRRFDACCF